MIPSSKTHKHNITATGSDQAGAYPLVTEIAYIGGGAGTTGVRLSSTESLGGKEHLIANLSGSNKSVYPASGQSINGLSSDTPITLATSTGMTCVSTSSGGWYCWTGSMPVT